MRRDTATVLHVQLTKEEDSLLNMVANALDISRAEATRRGIVYLSSFLLETREGNNASKGHEQIKSGD